MLQKFVAKISLDFVNYFFSSVLYLRIPPLNFRAEYAAFVAVRIFFLSFFALLVSLHFALLPASYDYYAL